MVCPGKEPAATPPRAPRTDDDDDDATQMTAQDSRWLAGINRQAQQDAHVHQVAASQAASVKRKANAMSDAEKAAAQQQYAAKVLQCCLLCQKCALVYSACRLD